MGQAPIRNHPQPDNAVFDNAAAPGYDKSQFRHDRKPMMTLAPTAPSTDVPLFADCDLPELLQQAAAAYAAGDVRRWAGVLWAAADRAVWQLGRQRSIAGATTLEILQCLDRQEPGQRPTYASFYSTIGALQVHCQTGTHDDYLGPDLYEDARQFIRGCYD